MGRAPTTPASGRQTWFRPTATCGAVARESATVYGSGPRTIAPSPGTISVAAVPVSRYAEPRTTATRLSGASSSIRIDHGGDSSERRMNAPRARGSSRPPTGSIRLSVDAGAWNRPSAAGIDSPTDDVLAAAGTVVLLIGIIRR